MRTQSDVKSQKIEYLSRLQDPQSKSKLRVFLLQEVFLALVVQSVGVSKYATQAQESQLNSRATNKGFFFFI